MARWKTSSQILTWNIPIGLFMLDSKIPTGIFPVYNQYLEPHLGKAEDTRQTIIEKAAVIFNKNGYQRTSMAMLCNALGLTKGAIYGHFADKDALAVEAFRYSVGQLSERVGKKLREQKGEIGKLRAFALTFVDFFEDTVREGGCPILNTAVDSDDAHPQLHQEVRRVMTAWEGRLASMVDAGKETGEIRPETDGALFAANFIALIEGGILLAKTVGDRKYLERAVKGINILLDRMAYAAK
jgi:TetR/AcrR family transcriptional regulator, transcriptional repressor for nem operon